MVAGTQTSPNGNTQANASNQRKPKRNFICSSLWGESCISWSQAYRNRGIFGYQFLALFTLE
jgi:hypothetical protein